MKTFISEIIDRGSTLFLKLVILFLGIAATSLLVFLTYISITSEGVGMYRPILWGICIAIFPFLYGLYQAFQLLVSVDRNEAFSEFSVATLKRIKIAAIVMGGLFTCGMPYIYYVGEVDDAPGVILVGMVLAAAPFVVAVIIAVLLKLLQNGIDIKSENELTV